MSLYKSYVPLHTCSECGEHIDEGEVMWSDGFTCLCKDCARKDYEPVDEE